MNLFSLNFFKLLFLKFFVFRRTDLPEFFDHNLILDYFLCPVVGVSIYMEHISLRFLISHSLPLLYIWQLQAWLVSLIILSLKDYYNNPLYRYFHLWLPWQLHHRLPLIFLSIGVSSYHNSFPRFVPDLRSNHSNSSNDIYL